MSSICLPPMVRVVFPFICPQIIPGELVAFVSIRVPLVATQFAHPLSQVSKLISATEPFFFFFPFSRYFTCWKIFMSMITMDFKKIGLWLLYNVVLISAVPQSESAICIHISPPFSASFPAPPLNYPPPPGCPSTHNPLPEQLLRCKFGEEDWVDIL